MASKNVMVIHGTEWSRLKKQACSSVEEDSKGINHEHLKHLKEMSQSWINKWPDSIQGYVQKRDLIKHRQHLKDITAIKTFTRNVKRDFNKEAVQDARRKIFEDSCYGTQLTSALIASKTLEEREVQIQFKNNIESNKIQNDKQSKTNREDDTYFSKRNMSQEEEKRLKTLKNIEIAQINRSIYKMQREKRYKEKQEEKQMRNDLVEMNRRFEIIEAQEKEKLIERNKKDIEECKAEQKRIKSEKSNREQFEHKLNTAWCKYQDRRNCKEKQIHNELHKNRSETGSYKINHETVRKTQEEKEKKYQEFVETGIKHYELQLKAKEKFDLEREKIKQQNVKDIINFNQMNSKNLKDISIVCHRQCVLSNSCKKKPVYIPDVHKFVKKLNKDQSPGWTGAESTHAQFVLYAEQVLAQSKYKNMAQKVIENYMKNNNLDATAFDLN